MKHFPLHILVTTLALVFSAAYITVFAQEYSTNGNLRSSNSSPRIITSVSTSTTSATQKVIDTLKTKPSKALRIFFESRNVNARPEGYETLLTIEDDGVIRFEFHTVSGRRDSVIAHLKPKELQALKKALNFPKLLEGEVVQRLVYADWMQSLTVEKDEKRKTLRFMVDVQRRTRENIDKHIQEQLGEDLTRHAWQFIQIVRMLNDRFRF